jgi:hypothetical protein
MQLYYGDGGLANPIGYSRFIFDLDLTLLREKLATGVISTGCTDNMTHTLKMTNTSAFSMDLLNTSMPDGSMRATSFDLILFRIPPKDLDPAQPQYWDEGVGYDFYDVPDQLLPNKAFSLRPSNWFQTTTIDTWEQPGIYNNMNIGPVPFSGLTIVDIQHFEFGNEDIEFDMTDEINQLLLGGIVDPAGWGIAYLPDVENLVGTSGSYSVGFFTRHTQTFYEPFLLTTYNDLITDDRNLFVERTPNKLFLFAYVDGDLVTLDETPIVNILNPDGDPIPSLSGLTTCQRTKGIYEVSIPSMSGYSTPCQFTDVWTNIIYDGIQLPSIENEFTLRPYKNRIMIGSESREPEIFGFDFYGIKQDEKILNPDIRKVGVSIKKAYTTKQLLQNINAFYRVYVREGNTEVQVQDWTKINRTPNEYYFIFDTRDKIPNEYYIDIKVNTSGITDTYKRTIKFLIVNKK